MTSSDASRPDDQGTSPIVALVEWQAPGMAAVEVQEVAADHGPTVPGMNLSGE